ncbi:hypothetical protein SDC9_130777 [bioreactor metagenome]|uniref:Uncharacterized protein n=1 Tax=bioreactor metagenome TaxID=1076179 RepID=A0A645D3S8_9ZZZZ
MGGLDDGAAGPDDLLGGGVHVDGTDVGAPEPGMALAEEGGLHDPGDRILRRELVGGIAELVGVAQCDDVPAEDVTVELEAPGVRGGEDLEPARCAGDRHLLDAVEVGGLPEARRAPAGVGDQAHRAGVTDLHRRDDHRAAVGGGPVTGGLGVRGVEIDDPRVRAGRHVRRPAHHAADDGVAAPDHGVVAELGALVLEGPAEDVPVERPGLLDVGGGEVDPGRATLRNRVLAHGAILAVTYDT